MSKLAEFVVTKGVVDDISHEGLRSLLREERVSFQRIKPRKVSNHPDFEPKKYWVLELYAIADGHRRPRHGGDSPAAASTVRHLPAVYDLGADKVSGHVTTSEVRTRCIAFSRYLRPLYPPEVHIGMVPGNFPLRTSSLVWPFVLSDERPYTGTTFDPGPSVPRLTRSAYRLTVSPGSSPGRALRLARRAGRPVQADVLSGAGVGTDER